MVRNGSYISPRKAELTLALRGLICNQKSGFRTGCEQAKKTTQPLENEVENEVDMIKIQAED
jgi:hypothetical protein